MPCQVPPLLYITAAVSSVLVCTGRQWTSSVYCLQPPPSPSPPLQLLQTFRTALDCDSAEPQCHRRCCCCCCCCTCWTFRGDPYFLLCCLQNRWKKPISTFRSPVIWRWSTHKHTFVMVTRTVAIKKIEQQQHWNSTPSPVATPVAVVVNGQRSPSFSCHHHHHHHHHHQLASKKMVIKDDQKRLSDGGWVQEDGGKHRLIFLHFYKFIC